MLVLLCFLLDIRLCCGLSQFFVSPIRLEHLLNAGERFRKDRERSKLAEQ
jgi:hypothetical protein